MAKETIRVKIDKDGNMEISVSGIRGKTCTEITSDLEVYLGRVGEREYTADYYKKPEEPRNTWITRR